MSQDVHALAACHAHASIADPMAYLASTLSALKVLADLIEAGTGLGMSEKLSYCATGCSYAQLLAGLNVEPSEYFRWGQRNAA